MTPRLWAHRGSHRAAVENTLAAFALAIEEGADGVELDVRATADGEVVVFHDAELTRLANDPRPLSSCTRAELPEVAGAPVPTLDEALDLLLGAGLEVNVEIKAGELETARALAARTAAEREAVVVSCFRFEALEALRAELADVRIAFLFERVDAVSDAILEAVDGLHPHFSLCDPARVSAWQARGRFVNVWTVNAEDVAVSLTAAGVDGLVTDDVPRLRGACEKHS